MRTFQALFLGGILCAIALASPAPAQPLNQPVATASIGDAREVFRKKFMGAISINSTKEMERLFRTNSSEAAIWILDVAYSQVLRPSDEFFDLFVKLETTWKKVKRTEFPVEMRRFFESLQGREFKLYKNLVRDYNKLIIEYHAELKAEDGPKPSAMVTFAARFDRMFADFDGLRCDYYASQCAAFAGISWDKDRAKDLQNLEKACTAYGFMIDTRERMGLKDSILLSGKPRYKQLLALGHGPEGTGPAAEPAAGPDTGDGDSGGPAGDLSAASDFVNVPMEFELLQSIEQFKRPNYFVDEHYPLWLSLFLRDVGSSTTSILRFGGLLKKSGSAISARRDTSAKVYFDMDGDEEFGEGDIDIPIKGKREAVHVELAIEGRKHHMAFFVQTGQEKDQYQGLETNLQVSDTQVSIYASPAGSMVGTLGGESLRIIDEDLDGAYGSKVQPYPHVGLTENRFQPEFDSMVLGSSKRALPWSRYILIGKQWFDLKSDNEGTTLSASPVTLTTGTLQLKFKGPKPAFVIVQGMDTLSEVYFDLSSKSKVEVPVGRYQLLSGMVTKGKKKQLQKVLMIPGSGDLIWEVSVGGTTKVELGGPFKFDFKCDGDSKGCQVIGATVAVVGVAGERYERPWLCVPKPIASGRKAGSKRGSKPEKMPVITSTQKVAEKGWDITWFPGDLAIDIKNVEGSVEVQLTQKKHPLFGKLTSDWLPFER